MEPRIQYARTADGVSIAFWTLGEGMPLIRMQAAPFQHCQLEWRIPDFRRQYELLARRRMLVRFDGRGSGLSDRDVTDYSLEAHVSDLTAVVDALVLKEFDLVGFAGSGPTAIAYAARHPEQLSHLILWDTFPRIADFLDLPKMQAISDLMEKDWELYTETLAQMVFGWSGEQARGIAAFFRECATADSAKAHLAGGRSIDVTDLLPNVRTPTLVVHQSQVPTATLELSKTLASRIPNARLAVLEGDYGMPDEVQVQTIEEFLGEGEPAAEAEPPEAGAFRTILFTDVEESTALTQRLGDARAREVLRTHERIVREALRAHGGAEVKTMGDGFMASFSSATRALECAVAMQRAFAEHNESAEEPIRVRVGLNAGEPIAEEDDLFGTAVILAARIAAQGDGGQILASNVVRELVAGKDFLFSDRGETALRGFEDPVRLYEVRWRES